MNDWLLARVFLLLGGIAFLALVVVMAVDKLRGQKPPPPDDDISGWGV